MLKKQSRVQQDEIFIHIKKMSETRIHVKVLEAQEVGRRPKGRSWKRWMERLKEILITNQEELVWEGVFKEQLCNDRRMWKG